MKLAGILSVGIALLASVERVPAQDVWCGSARSCEQARPACERYAAANPDKKVGCDASYLRCQKTGVWSNPYNFRYPGGRCRVR